MKHYIKMSVLLFCLAGLLSCNSNPSNENTIISMKTSLGDIKIKLYDGTPVHRDNFISLVISGFYDGVSFHRVIKNFMVQAGDPETRTGSAQPMPDSLKTYTIPAEFNPQYYHKRGALAAARESNETNPEMRSSGTQFYLVQGVKFSDEELNQAEQKINSNAKQNAFSLFIKATADSVRLAGKTLSDAEIQETASIKMFQYLSSYKEFRIPEEQRNIYKTIGGTPRLDGSYTVFGEVIEGLDIIDKIAEVQTDNSDKPIAEVKIIKIKIVKN
jgi:cyclophilin family peptidyl-prolyl cis-trans isomerase